MNKLEDRFLKLVKQYGYNKNIHPNSVLNFIKNLDNIHPYASYIRCRNLIEGYLSYLETCKNINHAESIFIYKNYILPLGEYYKKIGFYKLIPFKSLFIVAIMLDIVISLILFLPIPAMSSVVFMYYLLKRKNTSLPRFGAFY
jgi:hypothetical protein